MLYKDYTENTEMRLYDFNHRHKEDGIVLLLDDNQIKLCHVRTKELRDKHNKYKCIL